MVHSVELLFDPTTDAAVRQAWNDLAQNGIRSLAGHQSPTNRPHVTLTVAGSMGDGVDDALAPLLACLPFHCVLGAPMLFGHGRSVTLYASWCRRPNCCSCSRRCTGPACHT